MTTTTSPIIVQTPPINRTSPAMPFVLHVVVAAALLPMLRHPAAARATAR